MTKPNLFFPTPVWTIQLDNYKKINVSIQGESLRITGKSKDDLQSAIELKNIGTKINYLLDKLLMTC